MVLNKEDMESNEEERYKGQHGNVEGIEAYQCVASYINASPQERFDEFTNNRQIASSTRSHPHSGKGPLIPEQEIAAESKENGNPQENESGEPEKFPWFPVCLEEQGAPDMNEKDNDGDLGTPVMKGAEKPTHIQFCNDINDALVGLLEIRDIVKRENHACYELDDEEKKDDTAGVIPYLVLVNWNKLLLCKAFHLFKVVSF